jgi:hypothetical protein
MKLRGLTALIALAMMLSMLFAPFYQSSPITEKKTDFPPGWTEDIRLTNNAPFPDYYPSIAVDQEKVHIVWFYLWGTPQLPGQSDIVYVNSNDAGQTWNNRQILSPGDPIDVQDPDIAVNGSNNIHVVWCDSRGISTFEIIYCNSTDGGITWSDSKMISMDDGQWSESPQIGVSNSNIHVIWVDARHGPDSSPPNTEIYYVRSTDGGITWDDGLGNVGQERRLTNAPYASAPVGIVVNGNAIHVLWSDGRNGISKGDVYYKRSLDNGATWEDGLGNINQDRRITTNSTDHIASSIAVSGSTIHTAWTDAIGSNYYIYYRNSTDNGATWGTIKLLVGPFPGTTFKPRLAAYNNTVHIVWMDMRDDGSTREIYYKNSTDAGANWNPDWRLTYSPGTNSWWPEIKVEGNQIHIAWWDDRDGNNEVYYKRYPDFPDTTPPSHTNESPPPDSYKDAPGTLVYVHVTDPSGVNASTIRLYVNGYSVLYNLTSIPGGYNVSYLHEAGFAPGLVTCRIVAKDTLNNRLDYTWNFTVLAVRDIALVEGWNLVSVPFIQVNASIEEVLKDIAGKWDRAMLYDPIEPDRWRQYYTGWSLPNDFSVVDNNIGFWLNVTEPNVTLRVRGNLPMSTSIPLYAGWNLVGYPSLSTNVTVADALWGTGADIVEVFDQSATYRTKVVGPTYVMKPGEGYWVHVVADSVWIVD